MPHTHIHVITSLMKTSRRRLGTFQQSNIISDTGQKVLLHFLSVFKVSFRAKLIKLVTLKMSLQHLVVQLVIKHSILLVQTKKKRTLYFVITHSAPCHVVSNLSSSGPWLSLHFILQSCTNESFVSTAYKCFYYL